ncbi:three-Cys-motif partner protein TcmP, partial [bacterium]|nr:three-Cys-motif partner protein TcmP [bacterium]
MISKKSNDPNDNYFEAYNNFQRSKHKIIQSYLKGWYPKLGTWNKEIVYIDTHAGRGKHSDGHLGSPIIALKTIIDHSYRIKLLKDCNVKFYFMEKDTDNFNNLATVIRDLGELPPNINVKLINGDSFEILSTVNLNTPAFIFIDPFGFKIPGTVLQRLMQFKRVELFINIMFRELNMALSQKMESTLNEIFGSNS